MARTRCGEEGTEQDRDMPREVEGICSFIQEHYKKRLTLDTICLLYTSWEPWQLPVSSLRRQPAIYS